MRSTVSFHVSFHRAVIFLSYLSSVVLLSVCTYIYPSFCSYTVVEPE
jgi:hypothetical protein